MNVLTLRNSIASREVISPAVAVSVAFAKMVAHWLSVVLHRSLVLPCGHDIDPVGEFKWGLSMSIFLQYTLSLLFFTSWLSVFMVVGTSSLWFDFSYVHVSSIRIHECY